MTEPQAPLPLVAIVGRPNVGKSTLFNRLVGRRLAIVMNTPGVTRDRQYLTVDWGRLRFTLVDTGGVDMDDPDPLSNDVSHQSLSTLESADVVVFMTDAREGLTVTDRELASTLRRTPQPIIHLVNKCDAEKIAQDAMEAAELGFDPVIPCSAEHGRGLDDLYDALAEMLPHDLPDPEEQEGDPVTRVAVVGRPNAGKSTLINRLLGEDRLVVSDVAGTTRDAIDSVVTYDETPYLFIDTAGIRRRGRIDKGVERASITRAMTAIERSEVAVILMDGEEGITEQDTKIAGHVLLTKRGCVLVVNKWDTQKGDSEARKRTESELHRRFPFLTFAPVLFMSGLTGMRVSRLFEQVDEVAESFRRRIPTGELNRAVNDLIARQSPPMLRHRPVRIYYATQVAAAPPRFVLFCNQPDGLEKGYLRYLENGLRERFGFTGTPLTISVRHRDKTKR